MAAETSRAEVEGLLGELGALLRSFAHGPPLAGETARIGALLRRLARALGSGGQDGACVLASDMALAVESWRAADDVVVGALERCLRGLAALGRSEAGQAHEGRPEAVRPITLVNELRALRGAPLLSGNAVVELDLDEMVLDTHHPSAASNLDTHDSVSDLDTHHSASARPGEALPDAARRWRAVYQRGVIGWLRGGEEDGGAARIMEACDAMASLCHAQPQGRLWEIAAVFAEVLEDRRWRRSTAVKRLLGQLDGQLKRLAADADAALDAPASLGKSLLYYVAVAPVVGRRAAAARERYDLARAFSVSRRTDETPNPVLALTLLNELLTVAGALLEPLPPAGGGVERQTTLAGNLLHVADGLALLGLPALRCEIMEELSLFEASRATGDPPPGGWGEMAERLHACGVALLEAAGMEPAAAFAGDALPAERGSLLPSRLDADLTHAEEIIRRLETAAPVQGDAVPGDAPGEVHPDVPAAPSEPRSGSDAMADAARELSQRLARLSAPSPSGESAAAAAPAPAPDAELVDDLLLIAAEVGAARTRLEQQAGALRDGLHGMDRILRALREELGSLRSQVEPGEEPGSAAPGAGNPSLWARVEGLARGIAELSKLRGVFEDIADEHRAVLGRQARDSHALTERLMRTRMQPLHGQLGALRRRVEESAARAGKQITLHAEAGDVHLEPEKLAVLMPVLGNLLEELVRRGVERPHERVLVGKPPGCAVSIDFTRRGADLELDLRADCPPPPPASLAFLEPELAPLGARLHVRAGDATTLCTLRLPLAPRVRAVLLVESGGETLALPLGEVDAVVQADAESLSGGDYEHGGERYPLAVLAEVLGFDTGAQTSSGHGSRVPLVLVSAEEARRALAVDRIGDRVDVVVQPVGPQLRSLSGLAGASILGDGAVVLLLDVTWLVGVSKPCEASV